MTLVLSPRKWALVLALLTLCLSFAHFSTQFITYLTGHDYQFGLAPQFNLDADSNIPAWYASSTLLLCSLLLAVIGLVKKQLGDRFAQQWLILAAIFLYLSLDEAASLHEMTSRPLRDALKITSSYLHWPHAWVIPGSIFVLVVLLAYLRFLAALPVKTRHLFLFAGTLYVGGALGIDSLEGYYVHLSGSYNTLTYSMLVGFEEGLEMIGVVVFIYSLLSYMALNLSEIRILVIDRK